MPSFLGDQTCALRSEEHTSELQSLTNLGCRLLLEKKNIREVEGGTAGDGRAGRAKPQASARLSPTSSCTIGSGAAGQPSSRYPPQMFFFLNSAGPADFPPFPPRPVSGS